MKKLFSVFVFLMLTIFLTSVQANEPHPRINPARPGSIPLET